MGEEGGKSLTGDHFQPHYWRHCLCPNLLIRAWTEGPQLGQERGPISEGDGSDYPASLLQGSRVRRSAQSPEAATEEIDSSQLPPAVRDAYEKAKYDIISNILANF